VEIGTACLINPQSPKEIMKGIKGFLKEERIEDINEIIKSLRD
jgi:dihydroorotate dehydrogenase